MVVNTIGSSFALVNISSSMANRIQRLGIRTYVAFEEYATSPNMIGYWVHWPLSRNVSNTINYTTISSGLKGLNMSSNLKMLSFFSGFILSSTSGKNLFYLDIAVSQINSTAVRISVYSNSATPTFVDSIWFYWLSINL